MAVLAVEWSSRRLSVAIGRGEEVRERAVEVDRFRAPEGMALLDAVLGEFDGDLGEIRVGRGPGNYSGIRQAFAWAAGMAAPGGLRVTARSSGRAQACRLLGVSAPLWILGDARRGLWWGCRFSRETMEGEWMLAPPESWRERIGDEPVFSAEAERLGGLSNVIADMPRARDLLEAKELNEEEATPIYLHPPVAGA